MLRSQLCLFALYSIRGYACCIVKPEGTVMAYNSECKDLFDLKKSRLAKTYNIFLGLTIADYEIIKQKS